MLGNLWFVILELKKFGAVRLSRKKRWTRNDILLLKETVLCLSIAWQQ